ncbi:hypothetical protein KUTeg_015567 [Tegillarca granosa]|uniref:P53 and DNA damage-regulated protein 1 n=1 Tax=Tegillarca granosa TaxID=220873 RepID=A0ABQ9EW10_TEGGR|nr:hypothetical protein KUTeg_015567 [Tegillarca granosa]
MKMTSESEKVLKYLIEAEEIAEDILTDKQQLVDLDRKRQKTREAIRTLQKDKSSNKLWVCFGNMFLKLPKSQTKKLLEKDFDELDNEILDIRKNLIPKVGKLRDIDGQEDIKGFNLNPLSKDEMKAIVQMM